MSGPSLRLRRTPDSTAHVDAIAATYDGRVGLGAVLDDLDREAVAVEVPARAATYGFRWDDTDLADEHWWPQGITTSADASESDDVRGRRVVVVGWYAKKVADRPSRGTRLSFVDVTDEQRPRYRHVLLVRPAVDETSDQVGLAPVRIHAGGIVWYGGSILVADTHGGLRRFSLDDIVGVPGDGYDGHRYVLPQRTAYTAEVDEGFAPFRFSFVSLDRGGADHELLAGEYGREGQTTRLVSFGLDTAEESLALVDDEAHPRRLVADGLTQMQGATVVDGTYYISTSRGHRRGSMWTRPSHGPAREHPGTLAMGPEDLTYWRQRDEIWSVSEYPHHRYVYAMPRSAFARPPGRLRGLLEHLRPTTLLPTPPRGQFLPRFRGVSGG